MTLSPLQWPSIPRPYCKAVWRHQYGFTLLELLVVVVIVAILFTYTTLAIRNDGPEEVIQKEAKRMERLVELALEEAILRGEEYAIEISQGSYRFLHFVEDRWLPLSDDRILHERELPRDIELEVSLEDTEIVVDPAAGNKTSDNSDSDDESTEKAEAEIKPQIFLLSSGEITPEFDIRFYILGTETSYLVRGQFDGSLVTEKSDI